MKSLVLILLVCSNLLGFTQSTPSDSVLIDGVKYIPHIVDSASFVVKNTGDTLFLTVGKMPVLPGGDKAMFKFLSENVKFPPSAKAYGISGKIYINFVISKTGNVEKIKVLRGVHPILDNEALRVVSLLPRWSPAEHRGKAVAMSFNLPINFILIDDTNSSNFLNSRAKKSYKKGDKYFKKNNYEKAIEYYTEATLWYFDYSNAYYQRALCYERLNDIENACKDWKKCTELGDPRTQESINKYCN